MLQLTRDLHPELAAATNTLVVSGHFGMAELGSRHFRSDLVPAAGWQVVKENTPADEEKIREGEVLFAASCFRTENSDRRIILDRSGGIPGKAIWALLVKGVDQRYGNDSAYCKKRCLMSS